MYFRYFSNLIVLPQGKRRVEVKVAAGAATRRGAKAGIARRAARERRARVMRGSAAGARNAAAASHEAKRGEADTEHAGVHCKFNSCLHVRLSILHNWGANIFKPYNIKWGEGIGIH